MSVIYTAQETCLTSYAKYDKILQESLQLDILKVPFVLLWVLLHAFMAFFGNKYKRFAMSNDLPNLVVSAFRASTYLHHY